MLDRRSEYDRMAQAEGTLWWYRALHALVANAIRRHAPCAAPAILDAGCGTGGLMTVLRALGHGNVKGFDLSPDAVGFCRERGLNATCGNLLDTGALFEAASADVVVSNDTLCYCVWASGGGGGPPDGVPSRLFGEPQGRHPH